MNKMDKEINGKYGCLIFQTKETVMQKKLLVVVVFSLFMVLAVTTSGYAKTTLKLGTSTRVIFLPSWLVSSLITRLIPGAIWQVST